MAYLKKGDQIIKRIKMRVIYLHYFLISLCIILGITAAILQLIPPKYASLRFWSIPIGIVLSTYLFILRKDIFYLRNLTEIDKYSDIEIVHVAITIIYLRYLKRKYSLIILCTLLINCGALAFFILTNTDLIPYAIFLIPFLYCLLLIARYSLVKYRVYRGIFGTNKSEILEILQFVKLNSDDFDFHDSDGKLLPIFLPEALAIQEVGVPAGDEVTI